MLAKSPALGMVAQAFGAYNIPMTVANLGAFIASMNPESIASINQALANADPNAPNLTAQQALAYAAGLAGPTTGGPQPPSPTRGYSNFDPNNPPPDIAAQLGVTPPGIRGDAITFADIARGREDIAPAPPAPPEAPPEGPSGPPSEGEGPGPDF